MNINEWIGEIQAHKVLVVSAAIIVLAIVILFIRSFRRRPTMTMADSTEHRDNRDVTSRTTSTQTVITYQYTPAPATGRSYRSSTVRLSNRPNTPGLVDQYPVGKKVTVYYDPNDPTVATLELESTESFVGLLFGVALELMGIAGIYFLIRIGRFRRAHNGIAAVLDDGPTRSPTSS
jgi:hypothetical protein